MAFGKKMGSKTSPKEAIHKVVDDLGMMMEKAKEKYREADPMTKKKIIAGVVGSVALIAGAIGMKKTRKKDEEEE